MALDVNLKFSKLISKVDDAETKKPEKTKIVHK